MGLSVWMERMAELVGEILGAQIPNLTGDVAIQVVIIRLITMLTRQILTIAVGQRQEHRRARAVKEKASTVQ